MSRAGTAFALLLTTTLGAAVGCAGRAIEVRPEAQSVGVYRARVEQDGRRPRRFRLLLFAQAPDRLHGEVLTPVGSTALIFDGGDGRLAVSFVGDRVAFVGPTDREALAGVFGIEMDLVELVGALLGTSGPTPGYDVSRSRDASGALPSTLEISSAGGRLELELRRLQPLRLKGPAIGRGEPPAGFEVRDLAELASAPAPMWDEIEEDGGR